MADTIRSSETLKYELLFDDADTRTVTLKNPKPSLTLAQLQTAMDAHGSIFAGDKADGTYAGFRDARKVSVTTRYLDLDD